MFDSRIQTLSRALRTRWFFFDVYLRINTVQCIWIILVSLSKQIHFYAKQSLINIL